MNQQEKKPAALISHRSMIKGGVKLFSVFGIDIYINYSWFIVVFLIAWSFAYGYFPQQVPGKSTILYWELGFLTSVLFFTCILLHEISHSYVSKKLGIPVPRITLFIFGGAAQISKEPTDPDTEFKIAIAGPLMSLFLLAIFFGLYILFGELYNFPLSGALFSILAFLNGAVMVFNLVPGFPLDGGRLLRAYLWKKKKSLEKATSITSNVGKFFAMGLIFFGFFQLLLGNIIGGIWLIFIGFFLEQAAVSGYEQVLIQKGLTGTKVKEIMSDDIVSMKESLSLSEAVENYFFKHHFKTYPVIKNGKFIGCLTLSDVKRFPREEWSKVKVSEAIEEFPPELILRPEEEAIKALSNMVRSGRGRLPVVEEERLVGILTRRDIMSFLKIKTDLGA